MSRAGLRALRIGTFSTLVRPRALACLALISAVSDRFNPCRFTAAKFWPDARLAADPDVGHRTGAAVSAKSGGGYALHRDGYPSAASADGGVMRCHAWHGGGSDAVCHS